jgi:hypothetical protein
MNKCSPLSPIMNEAVCVPGFPQLIVTREFLYGWLAGLGWSKGERGFGSLDYLAFGREASLKPLAPDAERDAALSELLLAAPDYDRRRVMR